MLLCHSKGRSLSSLWVGLATAQTTCSAGGAGQGRQARRRGCASLVGQRLRRRRVGFTQTQLLLGSHCRGVLHPENRPGAGAASVLCIPQVGDRAARQPGPEEVTVCPGAQAPFPQGETRRACRSRSLRGVSDPNSWAPGLSSVRRWGPCVLRGPSASLPAPGPEERARRLVTTAP